jgi:hypothetical protein
MTPAFKPTLDDIRAEWLTFRKREALLMSSSVGVALAPFVAWREPQLDEALCAILYINLVSVFDVAMSTQMSWRLFKDKGNTKPRANLLKKRGQLLADDDAIKIVDRRNDLAHGRGPAMTRAEFKTAVTTVTREFVGWGLIPLNEPPIHQSFSLTPID